MRTGAEFSPDERYRYRLMRRWREAGPRALFVMLNPSTATAEKDDPTINRCVGFADALGCGRLDVANVYALRSTEPDLLLVEPEPIGRDNDSRILSAALQADWVICAWGCHVSVEGPTGSPHGGRGDKVATMLLDAGIKLHALRETQKGFPSHPLFLPGHLRPVPFHPTRRLDLHGR